MEMKQKYSPASDLIFVVLVFLISSLFFIATNLPNNDINKSLYQKEANLYNTALQLEAEQIKLKKIIDALESDPLFVEYAMREKFKMKKPGEIIISKGTE